MKIIKTKNYSEMSRVAAQVLIEQIRLKPDSVIGFATGKTPLGMYKNLVNGYKKKKVDFSKIKTFNLDEYYPIKKEDRKSYHYYMFKNLFDKVNVFRKNVNLLNGEVKDFKKECKNYEKKIKKNRIDLAVLGVGVNGHIGFNEPGSKKTSETRLVELSEETVKRNSGFFSKVPDKVLTMGIKTILSAKRIVLLASGKEKAEAIKHLVKGKETSDWPVSFLKKHKGLVVIVDE